MPEYPSCVLKRLPPELAYPAALVASAVDPRNAPPCLTVGMVVAGVTLPPEHLAVFATEFWKAGTVITVGFLDGGPADLQARILAHMNAWQAAGANVSFAITGTDPMLRVARAADGYWSYIGTDILSIPPDQPTMNLQGFTMATPESEYHRVVRHETGHVLGFPHEHMRKEIVARIDPGKAIAYFGRTQGWSAEEVTQQVLTPLDDSLLIEAPIEATSIMCYQLPGAIMTDGIAVPGGLDITTEDATFADRIYPGLAVNPPPPPHPSGLPPVAVGGGAVAAQIPAGGAARFALSVARLGVYRIRARIVGAPREAGLTIASTLPGSSPVPLPTHNGHADPHHLAPGDYVLAVTDPKGKAGVAKVAVELAGS